MVAKTLMLQGTASSVGKSLLVAALCRIFRQDGYRVAPFKAQNMALNSFVTREGGEMGRAQVVQAEAAGIEPSVDMNPILLKPEADARAQVIVRGRVYATLPARNYYSLKRYLLSVVEESLTRLRSAYDLVVIEGAGSPAEVNLKDDEIVNMRVARMAGAPVLLVGDIDRGGVFASLVGTLELLEPAERALVRGLIINKFRGDLSLLRPGLDFLERRTGLPVLGVVPYLRDIRIAQEDSVYLEQRRSHVQEEALVDIAVIRLPHISNFDDFDPLEQEPGVSLRYVATVEELGCPDLIVLPGTKSTVTDLRFLQRTGLARRIVELATSGVAVIGICGGFQMLGQEIHDPQHVESDEPMVAGLALLPVRTVFLPEKATYQVRARVVNLHGLLKYAGGYEIVGYEIHMGRSDLSGGQIAFRVIERCGLPMEEPDGVLNPTGHILGTYIHGLFQNQAVRLSLLRYLGERRGRSHPEWGSVISKEEHYDWLAAAVRRSLDMDAIYKICGLEGSRPGVSQGETY